MITYAVHAMLNHQRSNCMSSKVMPGDKYCSISAFIAASGGQLWDFGGPVGVNKGATEHLSAQMQR